MSESSRPSPPGSEDEPHPSVLETREFDSTRVYRPEPAPYQPPETTVPPETGNRTLWIILGIVAFIVLVCCCLLPLGLVAFSTLDSGFQDQFQSVIALLLRA